MQIKPIMCLVVTLLVPFTAKASEDELKKMLAVQKAEIEALKQEISRNVKPQLEACKTANANASWSEGKLCFLANGSCPAGFTRQEGHLRALRIYQDNNSPSSYLWEGTFGNSSIQWHGGTPYRYGEYAGELHLATCCR